MKKFFMKEYPYIKWLANRKKIEKDLKNEIRLQNKKIENLSLEFASLENKQEQKVKNALNSVINKLLDLESKNKILENKLKQDELDKLNNLLISGEYKNIILTTYPEFSTGNVGDAMITDAFVKLLKVHNPDFNFLRVFRGQSLEDLNLEHVKNIFAPGFSVAPGTYPKNYKLFDNIDDLDKFNFVPFGCSYQHYLPEDSSFSLERYKESDIKFLKNISNNYGLIPCRDEKIRVLMQEAGINSYYSGDLVLFDPDVIGSQYKGCKNIKSVAISVQHKSKYTKQSIELLTLIRNYFSDDVKIYLTLHGAENAITRKLEKIAKSLNIDTVSLYGESKNLSFYDSIDLHIGYRLHGHIYFLRQRKPSILLVEDARAYGFSKTSGTAYGCFDAMEKLTVSEMATKKIINFLDLQIEDCFKSYMDVFNFIDDTYYKIVEPRFKQISESTNVVRY
ncbi:polysaccharide pyruvyl transferase family protein [Photobacterium sp. DNB23_23_1]